LAYLRGMGVFMAIQKWPNKEQRFIPNWGGCITA
jgi:hypothetical protein